MTECKTEWIKVEDRLPDDSFDGRYVAIYTWSSAALEHIVTADVWIGNKFDFWGDRVKAWQPLPEAPQ